MVDDLQQWLDARTKTWVWQTPMMAMGRHNSSVRRVSQRLVGLLVVLGIPALASIVQAARGSSDSVGFARERRSHRAIARMTYFATTLVRVRSGLDRPPARCYNSLVQVLSIPAALGEDRQVIAGAPRSTAICGLHQLAVPWHPTRGGDADIARCHHVKCVLH
jgi:hypothetical protein